MSIRETSLGPLEMLEWGGGHNTLILLHASQTGPQALTELVNTIASPAWRFIAPALSGYGATRLRGHDADPVAASLEAVCEVVASQVTSGAGPTVLFGHSMGGLIAMLAAISGANVDALVLYEPIVLDLLDGSDPADADAQAWDRAIVADLERYAAAGDDEAAVRRFIEAWNEASWDTLPAALRRRLIAGVGLLRRETKVVSNLPLNKARLAGLTVPVYLLQGERSPPVTHRMSRQLALQVPVTQRTVIADCGHMGPVLDPAAVARVLRPVLTAHETTQTGAASLIR